MIFSFWQEHLDEFLDIMREQGFCIIVISAHKRFALSLEEDATAHGWHTYEDVRSHYQQLPDLKDKNRWFKLSIIKKLEDYQLHGILPVHRIVKDHVHETEPTQSLGQLDLFPMYEQIEDFIAFFVQQGKCDALVLSVRRTVTRITKLSGTIKWDSYQDIKDWYSSKGLSDKYLRKIHVIIDQMEYWQAKGTLAGWDDFRKSSEPHRRHVIIARKRMLVEPSLGELDLSYVQVHMDDLLGCMRDKGYSESSVERTRSDLNRIIMLSRSIKWDSVQKIRTWNENRPVSHGYKRTVSKSLERMERWLSVGDVPDHPSVQKALDAGIISIGKLDLSFWADHLDELLNYMEDHGYCKDWRLKIHFHARKLAVLSQTISWDSYEDIWEWYSSQEYRKGYLHDVRAVIGILEEFHIYGTMPNNRATQNPLCPRKNAYSKLVPEYRQLVDFVCEAEERRGLKPNTLKCTKTKASSFLYSLQSKGADSLEKVTEENVLAYFYENGRHLRGQSTASRISLFFRTCMPLNPDECRRIGVYIPKFHSSRKTIQYLTGDESDSFREALWDDSNGLSCKERAIGSVVFYTGMRGSDVSNLTLGDIDLRKRTIQFVQEKTGIPVLLPLSTVVGNAIYDYCALERPSIVDNEFLFLCDDAPHNRLGKGGIEWAIAKVMDAAGIRQEAGARKGGHIFRHRAASTMAENNIPSPVISATLGHSSPKSLDAYLYADMEHLRECALGLEKYPLAKEVISLV